MDNYWIVFTIICFVGVAVILYIILNYYSSKAKSSNINKLLDENIANCKECEINYTEGSVKIVK